MFDREEAEELRRNLSIKYNTKSSMNIFGAATASQSKLKFSGSIHRILEVVCEDQQFDDEGKSN
jgi:hypothetical protein